MNKRKIAVFTCSRGEYGLLHPVLRELGREPSFEVNLIVAGSHLLKQYGMSMKEIESLFLKRLIKINTSTTENGKIKLLRAFSKTIDQGERIISRLNPDILLLAGDRYETYAMAIAGFYMNIPIAHIFGGDLYQGGHLDDSARHSITKLAHIHFATNADSFERILGLGEEKFRVFNVGSPAVDNALSRDCASRSDVAIKLGLDLSKPVLVFTQHPVTTESEQAYFQVKQSLDALKELGLQTVITYPCNDPGAEDIIRAINEYASNPHFRIIKSLGWRYYLGLLKVSSAVIGNSSSGIMETPIFKVPCINIGSRQKGRLRADNVINAPYDKEKIKKAIIKTLTDRNFIKKVNKSKNPYGSGGTSKKIARILKRIPLDKKLLQKKMTF